MAWLPGMDPGESGSAPMCARHEELSGDVEGGTPVSETSEEHALPYTVTPDEAIARSRRELQVGSCEEVLLAYGHADVGNVDEFGHGDGICRVEACRLRRGREVGRGCRMQRVHV